METDRRIPQDAERALGYEERGKERAEDAADRSTAGAEHPLQTAGAEHPLQTAGAEHPLQTAGAERPPQTSGGAERPPQTSGGAERPPQKSRGRITVLLVMLLCVAAAGVVMLLRSRARQDPPEPPVSAADTFDPQAAYASAVEDFSDALRRIEQGASVDDIKGDLNPLFQPWTASVAGFPEGAAYSYAFYDVNGDGVEEMLIGRKNENQNDIVIVDVLVWRDGAPARLCEPYEPKDFSFSPYSPGFVPFAYLISVDGEIAFDFGWNMDYCCMICGTIPESGDYLVQQGLFGFYEFTGSENYYDWVYYLFPCDDPAMSYGQFIDDYMWRAHEDGERLDSDQNDRGWGWDYYSSRFTLIEPDWIAF